MSALNVDLDLVRRYNVPGPRYTSYPPATHFQAGNDAASLQGHIRGCNQLGGDLSLYFHLPFCHSLCWFCGCTTVISSQQRDSASYLDYLKKELSLAGNLMDGKRRVVQWHLGGGTPTFLLPAELQSLSESVGEYFDVAPDAELSVEIDPRRLQRDHLKVLRAAGFNRVSLGVQDHNPIVQKAVHRHQPFALTKTAVDWIRSAGIQSLNLDLIYGLPYQTVESFERTLDEVLYLRPSRLAVFSYAHVPWAKPAQRILEKRILPGPDVKLEILKLTIEKLTGEGFVYIGMDHFAREDDELAVAQRNGTLQRNFQGYSTRAGADLFGFGLSAISQAGSAYWQNQKEIGLYYASLDAGRSPAAKSYFLTEDDLIRRKTIMAVMCRLELNYQALSRELEIDFAEYFAPELSSLADLEADSLVERTTSGMRITNMGRLFLRNIAMRFDAYSTASQPQQQQFSRTI